MQLFPEVTSYRKNREKLGIGFQFQKSPVVCEHRAEMWLKLLVNKWGLTRWSSGGSKQTYGER